MIIIVQRCEKKKTNINVQKHTFVTTYFLTSYIHVFCTNELHVMIDEILLTIKQFGSFKHVLASVCPGINL